MRALTVDGPRSRPRVRDVPAPVLGPGELLVEVRSSAVTGIDRAIADGRLLSRVDHVFPVTLGRSWAGVVVDVGDDVRGRSASDRVFGLVLGDVVQRGSWAERLVVADDALVAATPDGVGDDVAGALGLAGVVAQNLVSAARAREGREVLVDGDVLGLAPLVVALAARTGARVIVTGTAADEDVLRAQGAHDVLEPGDDVVAALTALRPDGVDALIDLVDRDHDGFKAALGVLREGGYAVSAFGAATGSGRPDVDVTNVFLEPNPGQLDELAALVASGELPVPVARSVDLDSVGSVLASGTDDGRGLVVVTVAPVPVRDHGGT
ncbi:alcohol dehydrogenase catalytic domain-containing protein [Patulibacter minatonensis]|uniref:alcohol dehydrogenase catalytic domain-containing protein n=1 Tax=Patulibacter minatonensis TaxID=298163 RepID=UPI000689018F|nr:zinc-binding dehydrogenase [Patulibacter minatonensis]